MVTTSTVNKLNIPITEVEAASEQANLTTNYSSSSRKSRKRPVAEDEQDEQDDQGIPDELAIKRAKNAAAARRSRARKDEKMRKLEQEIIQLSTINSGLKTYQTVLKIEKKGLEERIIDKNNRIMALESQLTETYQRVIHVPKIARPKV